MLKMKPQMALALPKHMNADRMARLALTAFSSSPEMQRCEFRTIASSLMTAGAMGLEPGVNGAGYLIPYKGTCTFVPGWKGLVDLVSRSGRATVWTGAVFEGDDFEYALGDRPFVTHRPGDETDPAKLTHVYAIGRSNGSDYPVIEVWSMRKVWKHRDALNKQGGKHYSYRHPEMYARKVPLLQVLKYMPTSIEVANAIAVADAAESGRGAVIDGNFVTLADEPEHGIDPDTGEIDPPKTAAMPAMSAEAFDAKQAEWKSVVQSGKKTAEALISMLATKHVLGDEQKAAIRAFEDFSDAANGDE
ncbi:MAG: recombinase RecT [Ramlibacter sp.]|nr:recombinase RecT [Ramlibacter sp.]